MNNLTLAMLRCYVAAQTAVTAPRRRDERGDVPGWVMITVMTAGIVAIIWTVAQDQLTEMLKAAFAAVKPG